MTTPLAECLSQRIAREGAMGLDDYMAAALTHPRFGYYNRQAVQIGRTGDFTTAPEISQIFGELLGLWCADGWRRLGAPVPVALVELGPGNGTLMADALRAITHAAPDFARALELVFVETSPTLREKQRRACPQAKFVADIDSLPDMPMLLLANEFFDALPARRFHQCPEGWREEQVALDNAGQLVLQLAEPAPLPPECEVEGKGNVVCFSAAALDVAHKLARRLKQTGGLALVIDFAAKSGRSLQAVRQHKPCHVLAVPGECDIAVPVDFAALARAGKAEGVEVFGAVPQGVFLERLGLSLRVEQLVKAGQGEQEGLAAAALRLAHPSGMGSLFEAMAFRAGGTKPLPPAGFAP